jgi:hypothetical protein
VSSLRLKNKLDQVVFTNLHPIIADISKVYSHSSGELTGRISIGNNFTKVVNVRGLWKITK